MSWGITFSASEGQRWQQIQERHHHVVKFRVVDTCLRSQVLSSARGFLSPQPAFDVRFMTHQATRSATQPSTLYLFVVQIHLTWSRWMQLNDSRANWIRQWLLDILLSSDETHAWQTDILGYRKNDSEERYELGVNWTWGTDLNILKDQKIPCDTGVSPASSEVSSCQPGLRTEIVHSGVRNGWQPGLKQLAVGTMRKSERATLRSATLASVACLHHPLLNRSKNVSL